MALGSHYPKFPPWLCAVWGCQWVQWPSVRHVPPPASLHPPCPLPAIIWCPAHLQGAWGSHTYLPARRRKVVEKSALGCCSHPDRWVFHLSLRSPPIQLCHLGKQTPSPHSTFLPCLCKVTWLSLPRGLWRIVSTQ